MIYRIFFFCLIAISAASAAWASERNYVFAAASTTEPLQRAADLFEQKTGHKIKISFAGSSALAKQIEAGAPVGLFLSANEGWVDYLMGKDFIEPDGAVKYLTNQLVVIAARENEKIPTSIKLAALPDWLGDAKLSVADPDHVPAGIYAKEALEFLNIWEQVRSNLVRQSNVKGAVVFVSRGEAPLGIVYKTDALSEQKVRIVAPFPAQSHAPITYVLARVGGTPSAALLQFEAFLRSDEGATVFGKYGFNRYQGQ